VVVVETREAAGFVLLIVVLQQVCFGVVVFPPSTFRLILGAELREMDFEAVFFFTDGSSFCASRALRLRVLVRPV
jgi:hypothetical protein